MTAMMNTLRTLHRLHQQAQDLRDRLERGPKQVTARKAHLAKLEADLARLKEEVKVTQVSAHQKELQLKTSEAKIADLQVKLNQAKANREYQALKDQIAADQMTCSVLQDEILDSMDKVDLAKAKVPLAQQAIDTAQAEFAKIQAAVNAAHAGLETDLVRVEKNLRETEESLPVDMRDTYQRLVKSRGSDAMAIIEGRTCTGCHQMVTANMMNNLQLGKLAFCPACGRLIYLPEDRNVKGE